MIRALIFPSTLHSKSQNEGGQDKGRGLQERRAPVLRVGEVFFGTAAQHRGGGLY